MLLQFLIGCFIFIFIIMGVAGIRVLILQASLRSYLQKNHYVTWAELTTIGNSGPGLYNNRKFLGFVFDNEEFDDDKVQWLKNKIKRGYFYCITGMVCELIIFLLVFICMLNLNK